VDSAAGPLFERKTGLLVLGWVHLNSDLAWLGSRKETPKGTPKEASKEMLGHLGEELAAAEDLRAPLAEHYYCSCLVHHLRLRAGCLLYLRLYRHQGKIGLSL
jgi:hypothetical protein